MFNAFYLSFTIVTKKNVKSVDRWTFRQWELCLSLAQRSVRERSKRGDLMTTIAWLWHWNVFWRKSCPTAQRSWFSLRDIWQVTDITKRYSRLCLDVGLLPDSGWCSVYLRTCVIRFILSWRCGLTYLAIIFADSIAQYWHGNTISNARNTACWKQGRVSNFAWLICHMSWYITASQ